MTFYTIWVGDMVAKSRTKIGFWPDLIVLYTFLFSLDPCAEQPLVRRTLLTNSELSGNNELNNTEEFATKGREILELHMEPEIRFPKRKWLDLREQI